MTPGRVAVFRALMLGDLLCATPALRALRAGWPQAEITLVGLPWAAELAHRLPGVDHFIAFPGWPGLPEQPLADLRVLPAFLARLRARRFDLALQWHGSGRLTNALVAAFGAGATGGFTTPGGGCPAADAPRHLAWPDTGTEVQRLLASCAHLGLPLRGLHLDLPLHDGDRAEAAALRAPLRGRAYALVHPGAQLPSRRWPPERFAAVADALAGDGLAVLLTGSAGEAPLTRAVAAAMQTPALDLAGRSSLWSLAALVESAARVVCNDTGISHLAAALGTPSVVVANGSEVRRWAPADLQRHRVLWHDLPCRPCSHVHCPHGQACALGVSVAQVRQALAALP